MCCRKRTNKVYLKNSNKLNGLVILINNFYIENYDYKCK